MYSTVQYSTVRQELLPKKNRENSKRKEQRKITTRWKPMFWIQEPARMTDSWPQRIYWCVHNTSTWVPRHQPPCIHVSMCVQYTTLRTERREDLRNFIRCLKNLEFRRKMQLTVPERCRASEPRVRIRPLRRPPMPMPPIRQVRQSCWHYCPPSSGWDPEALRPAVLLPPHLPRRLLRRYVH